MIYVPTSESQKALFKQNPQYWTTLFNYVDEGTVDAIAALFKSLFGNYYQQFWGYNDTMVDFVAHTVANITTDVIKNPQPFSFFFKFFGFDLQ